MLGLSALPEDRCAHPLAAAPKTRTTACDLDWFSPICLKVNAACTRARYLFLYICQYHTTVKEKEDAMASHLTLSPQEAADRLTIRELFDAYAHCADTRDAEGQKA